MPDVVLQLAAQVARNPWPTFAMVLVLVLLVVSALGNNNFRSGSGGDPELGLFGGDGDGGDGGCGD